MPNPFLHLARLSTPAILTLAASGCSVLPVYTPPTSVHSLYTLQAENGNAIARVITTAAACPLITIDGRTQRMHERTALETVAARSGGAQADSKPAVFPVRSCETALPRGSRNASVEGQALPLTPAGHQRIVVIGDTGCRAKGSDNAFQECNDSAAWPFAAIAKQAAALQPDLVIHLGDLHYRESPCPAKQAGCANSPWGYGWDTWDADFFTPARALLQAAPWVFVRGNHESCARAGQGWYRFIDLQPWRAARSCNEVAHDGEADFSAPYAVPLNASTQLIVFDSARSGAQAYQPSQSDYQTYHAQLAQVGILAQQRPHSFFLSHHPVLALAPGKDINQPRPGSAALQSVLRDLYPGRYFPPGVALAMNGHEHVFEALSFSTDHPATYGLGNSGTMTEGRLPEVLPTNIQPAPGALINDFATRTGFGFALLAQAAQGWSMSEFSVQGQPVFHCVLLDGKSKCQPVGKE